MAISLDISVYRVISGELSPDYDENNIRLIIKHVNEIWSQADITFRCHYVANYHNEALNLPDDYDWLKNNIATLKPDNASPINVFLAEWHQNKPNGLRRSDAVMVRNDPILRSFNTPIACHITGHKAIVRVMAHEIGHVLRGSGHPQGPHLLMSSGFDGTDLPDEEIKASRKKAQEFLT